MKEHIKTVCKSAMAAIRCIGQIRGFLTNQATLTLVHAFVTSRIDSCNSLLFGLPATDIHRIQMLQNIAARLATRTRRQHSITQTLKKLHWLPVDRRIAFKVLLLTYKAQNSSTPSYLADLIPDLISQYHPPRNLRSSNQALLRIPKTNTSYYGSRAFAVAGSNLWNNLPQFIRHAPTFSNFKSMLKTYLFYLT